VLNIRIVWPSLFIQVNTLAGGYPPSMSHNPHPNMQMDYGHRLPFVKLMTATSFLHLHHNATATTLHTVESSHRMDAYKANYRCCFLCPEAFCGGDSEFLKYILQM